MYTGGKCCVIGVEMTKPFHCHYQHRHPTFLVWTGRRDHICHRGSAKWHGEMMLAMKVGCTTGDGDDGVVKCGEIAAEAMSDSEFLD